MQTFTIQVDFGFAMDFISICEVKCRKKPDSKVNIRNLKEIREHMENQIGKEKLQEVFDSQEYLNLFQANWELFDLVDLAKTNSVTAKQVDDGVYKRFLAKRALQKQFFPESREIEQKFGYEQK